MRSRTGTFTGWGMGFPTGRSDRLSTPILWKVWVHQQTAGRVAAKVLAQIVPSAPAAPLSGKQRRSSQPPAPGAPESCPKECWSHRSPACRLPGRHVSGHSHPSLHPALHLLAHLTLETNLLHRSELPHHLFPRLPPALFFFFIFLLPFLLWCQLRLSGFAIFP